MDYAVENIFKKIKNKSAYVSVPGSKSITNRALLLASLAEGTSVLSGAQQGDDCEIFLKAIEELGITASYEGGKIIIEGCAGVVPLKKASIYVGNAGTAARFLVTLLAFSDGEYFLDSDEKMKSRPMEPLLSCLENLGVRFYFPEKKYAFPFTVYGTSKPQTHKVKIDITKSSQYLSALLMCAPMIEGGLEIDVTGFHGTGYIDMTQDMMWSFGVDVKEKKGGFKVMGKYQGKQYDIEPDMSAASYFFAINKILKTDIKVKGAMPHSMQADNKFCSFLSSFDGGRIDMSPFSDQALTLAAIAPYLNKPTEIRGVKHIREQECDRIRAISYNLKNLGIKVEEFEDGIKIYPGTPKGCPIETYKDHRVAMSFAVTGLRCDGVVIKDCEVCSKTFKDFFGVLDRLIQDLT